MEFLVQRYFHRHQHGWPVDGMGFKDILGDQMLGHRPVFVKIYVVRIADAGEVIDQGIEPDVGDEGIVKGQLDPPGKP